MNYEEFIAGKRRSEIATGHQPGKLNEHLFDFQQAITAWAVRRGRAAIFADTGLGKTAMQVEWARQVVEYTCGSVIILAPLCVAQQTVAEAKKFGVDIQYCRDASKIKNKIVITNYEMMEHFDLSAFTGIVLDECFAKGTMVDTADGRMRIENIREGMYIRNAVGIDRASDVHRREVPYAVRVTAAAASFIASPNHPIFTQRGWVGAQHLRAGDYALETSASLPLVRSGVLSEISGTAGAAVLRDILLSEMADDAAGDSGSSALAGSRGEARGKKECVVRSEVSQGHEGVGTNHGVVPIHQTGGTRENQPHIEGHEAQSFRAWGEWQGAYSAAVDSDGCFGERLDSGVAFVTGPTSSRLSDALQARLRESEVENRDRGGWRIASQPESEGHQEGCGAGWVRVGGAEILEPGNPELEQLRDADGKLYFYDLGATRHPSYSVNGLLVHNSSILKSYMGKTKRAILEASQSIKYRLACTATPSPNDYLELGNHAEFLGIMPSNEMIMRFFINDTMEAGSYKLRPHAAEKFWQWCASWSVCLSNPADMGFDGSAYILPELRQEFVEVSTEGLQPAAGELFRTVTINATSIHKEGRVTIGRRAAEVAALCNGSDEAWLIWCNTNYEADAIKGLIPGAVDLRGSDSIDKKEESLRAFIAGETRVLISKPSICGMGLNLQHCRNMAFVGLSYSYEDYYQAIRRCWRFGQKRQVNCYVMAADSERSILKIIQAKEQAHNTMKQEMTKAISTFHKAKEARNETPYFGLERGDGWELHHADCVKASEIIEADSIGFSIYSPPFSNLYIYSDSDYDMGNSTNDGEFFEHYSYLAEQLYRITKPGRLTAIHCKDLPMYKGRDGSAGLRDFPGEIIKMYESKGWQYHSRITIWKDPVIEMQRTKNHGLLYKQLCKDSAASRQGMADYVIVMRKWGEEEKWEAVSRGGERFFDYIGSSENGPAAKQLARGRDAAERERLYSIAVWQRYASPVWFDIDQTDVLNYKLAKEKDEERHICPLQLGVIERAVELWSNPGDLVFSPFAGIGSEGYVSLKMGRRFCGVELKKSYFDIAKRNLAEALRTNGDLFSEHVA